MKKVDFRTLNVTTRKAVKEVRSIIKENNLTVIKDFITTPDKIQKERLLSLLKERGYDVSKIRFRNDNTPDMRSFPKDIRNVFKSLVEDLKTQQYNIIKEAMINDGADLEVVSEIVRRTSLAHKFATV
jgi:hypothetical protein